MITPRPTRRHISPVTAVIWLLVGGSLVAYPVLRMAAVVAAQFAPMVQR